MRLQLFIILLLPHFQLLANDNEFKVNDTLFVWADNGIIVRKQPGMESEALTKLNYGEKVIALEIVDRELEYEIIQPISIKNQVFPGIKVLGKFIKINLSGSVGYVYGGLLSRLKPTVGARDSKHISLVYLDN